jgi:hypothetical protein
MRMRKALFLAVGAAFSIARAQQPVPQPPVGSQPDYPGFQASNGPSNAGPNLIDRESDPGIGISSGASSPATYPVPPYSGGSEPGAPQMEVRPLTIKPLSPPAPVTRLEPVSENGVTYLCGGVGLDEAERMKREARNYSLILTFIARDGSYLADVNVDIVDEHGRSLLKVSCGAPMMLVDLPKSGNYRIQAEIGGNIVSRTSRIIPKQNGRPVTLVWPPQATDAQSPAN